ncbi:hypothetical protein [Kibdelosporangium philippinense]
MSDQPVKPTGPQDEPPYKKWSTIVGAIGAVAAALVAVHTLTGWNPLKDMTSSKGSATTTARVPVVNEADALTRDTYTKQPTWTRTTPPTTTTTRQRPDFTVVTVEWNGNCDRSYGCPMKAIFRNDGGWGTATATFDVMHNDDPNHYAARCNTVIPSVENGSVTAAGCTANSPWLQDYLRAHRGGSLPFTFKVYVTA